MNRVTWLKSEESQFEFVVTYHHDAFWLSMRWRLFKWQPIEMTLPEILTVTHAPLEIVQKLHALRADV